MNILIVDDEKIFRDYLRQALDWDRYGFRIGGEAKNGAEALAMAEEQRFDLALVDINMPIMDGLALTEKLKEKHPGIDVIVVTGHNEFEYARTAMRLGVEDYILKPFSQDELVLTLLKCRQKQKMSLEARQTEQADRQLMIESMLVRLVTGESSEPAERLFARLAQWGVEFETAAGTYSVACIEIDHMERRWNEPAERELWKFAVTNILAEAMGERGKPLLFNGPEGRIVCLHTEQDTIAEQGSVSDLNGYEELIFNIRKYLKLTVTIGVGGKYAGAAGIRRSYEQALMALRSKFLLGDDRVIPYNAETGETKEATAFLADTNETMLHLLRMGDKEHLEGKLDELFRSFRDNKLSLDYIYVTCMGWVSNCLSHVSESGHPIEDCYGEHFFPYTEIRALETAEAAREWMKALFVQTVDYVSKHKLTRAATIAKQARAFIEQAYGDPELSVESVAASAYINPSYLRAIFKKTFGMTVGEYMTHVRMNRAKELLGGNIRLADIAERIGYQDAGYFSKVFKKFYGITPSEYENSLRSGKG